MIIFLLFLFIITLLTIVVIRCIKNRRFALLFLLIGIFSFSLLQFGQWGFEALAYNPGINPTYSTSYRESNLAVAEKMRELKFYPIILIILGVSLTIKNYILQYKKDESS